MINKVGLVKVFSWEDPSKRGKVMLGSLTILFHEKDDSVFYKYNKDFEIPYDSCTKKIIEQMSTKAQIDQIDNEIKRFHNIIKDVLHQLAESEFNTVPDTEFPTTESEKKPAKFSLKIIVVGDSYSGKTSTILKYTNRAFRRSYIPTLGVNFTEKWIDYRKQKVQLLLWDLAGQSKFNTLRRTFYQGALGAILVYDLTNRSSYENIMKWYQDVKESFENMPTFQFVLCGNKKDLKEFIQVTHSEGLELAQKLKMKLFETSALTGENIDELFYQLVDQIFLANGYNV